MRKLKQTDIDKMLAKNYGGRISLAGKHWGTRVSTLWYCHECREWFHQNYYSIHRGFKTRCKCHFSERLDTENTWHKPRGAANTAGHRCLPEWECYDREIPSRPDIYRMKDL